MIWTPLYHPPLDDDKFCELGAACVGAQSEKLTNVMGVALAAREIVCMWG